MKDQENPLPPHHPVSLEEMIFCKTQAISSALGIRDLSEKDLLVRLEKLFWKGFAAGMLHEQDAAELRATSNKVKLN